MRSHSDLKDERQDAWNNPHTPKPENAAHWEHVDLDRRTAQGFTFELKGGTSLSKDFGIIQRFSEGISDVERDHAFDDDKFRSGGIRLCYDSAFNNPAGLKEGILLETGFDDTQPNMARMISSWAYDKASQSGVTIIDNRAIDIACYHPGYTFVEKLQTVSTKFRQQQEKGELPPNFLRHYYDISQLLPHPDVITFIGTPEYHARKEHRFRSDDNLNIAENEAFLLSDPATKEQYTHAYQVTASLYFGEQIPFDIILEMIQKQICKL